MMGDSGEAPPPEPRRAAKSSEAFRTISEVAADLDVPPHVLRFWETKFSQIRPMKRGGGRRYYRPEDVDLLRRIRALLYQEGYTIRGVQKLLRERGLKAPTVAEPPVAAPPVPAPAVATPETVTEPRPEVAPEPARGGPPQVTNLSAADRDRLCEVLSELEAMRAALTAD